MKIAVIIGSLRKESLNRKLAKNIIEMGAGVQWEIVEIGELPFYNEDLETATPPEAWINFRAKILAADAVLFVSPEYNRSVPAVIKNAIDVGSRPYVKNVWNGKPGAVVTASPGGTGGMCSNHTLRQSLMAVNILALAQPEVYVGKAHELFDESGKLKSDGTRAFLAKFEKALEEWVAKVKS